MTTSEIWDMVMDIVALFLVVGLFCFIIWQHSKDAEGCSLPWRLTYGISWILFLFTFIPFIPLGVAVYLGGLAESNLFGAAMFFCAWYGLGIMFYLLSKYAREHRNAPTN
ncbi:hypothetical protein KC878_02250 [Candidatus Saccharibacteria bacterium]|nr:hypothetical protein [Candidatus Saccharibacteria bacterium]MCB9821339.1 hypothetical protein [Candidatus Nomurabacteria bacterium]